jgi:hypothetical protein
MRYIQQLWLVLFVALGAQTASAFALLGPFAPWMTAPLAYQIPNAIGGPMIIGQGYRWNVPVVTYGYDQSFLDYFGTNGVAAVEAAIQILNSLPPASQINLTNYPLYNARNNYSAQSQSLLDLKSTALVMLLEQMGLAPPSASVNSLRTFSYNPINYVAEYTVETRNYDPTNLRETPEVNNILFGQIVELRVGNAFFSYSDGSQDADVQEFGEAGALPPGDVFAIGEAIPTGSYYSAVADDEFASQLYGSGIPNGQFFSSLTRDDAGGLAYQLSTNNVALENLLPGVRGYGTNAGNYVIKALRPGMDNITFSQMVCISTNPLVFATITNQYVDSYFTNGTVQQQTLERVITQPDILFTAKYVGLDTVSRTGTTNWVNNGAPLNDGPGVIQPPIVINFNQLGPSLAFDSSTYPSPGGGEPILPIWGSFDGTTNPPVVYPASSAMTNSTEFHFFLLAPSGSVASSFTWNLPGQPNALVSLQTSVDLSNWVSIATVTNSGGTFTYEDLVFTNTTQRYFRTRPQ